MKIRNRETGQEVVMPDDTRLVMGWWQSESKLISYPASEWDAVKESRG